ncbi:MAG: 2,3-bisphosphoglycerate-independent phosphoglycerate mutase [Deltaproteobacteria bacterium]|jgi:2,3-bisphosphoglycerate-independent phosphoglycerate mutase|nr:2,3-bisphosphoglycerate-independent phosphoglycerate mutase [Deltaproteobacteria bacterium]
MRPSQIDFIKNLLIPAETKIVLLVLDGLGGLPQKKGGLTELEDAYTPNLDMLAKEAMCGLHEPVGAGITPGSGPAHLALFGYNPRQFQVGRGVMSALGIGFDLRDGDVAARGNFCTVDDAGRVIDRRAGRMETAKNRELCALLSEIEIPGLELFIKPVKEYRFVLVLRGPDLSPRLGDTDPQQTGRQPHQLEARTPEAENTAYLVQQFLDQARQILAAHDPANMVVLRGFSSRPVWPTFNQAFGLRGAALAGYPMYRGLARLLGMRVLECQEPLESKIAALKAHWQEFDFFYIHVKGIDSAGEDGNAAQKKELLTEVDHYMPALRSLDPEVLIVTGDHSTPAAMKSHSWHPVPALLWAANCRPDDVKVFGERACLAGGLGARFPATDLIPLALAHAGRLAKFGA